MGEGTYEGSDVENVIAHRLRAVDGPFLGQSFLGRSGFLLRRPNNAQRTYADTAHHHHHTG